MAKYGILKSSTNTGLDTELIAVFSAPLSITSKKPSLLVETLTLKRKTAYTDIQRWELQTGIVPLADASEMFLHNVVNGYSESFYIRMPQIYRIKNLSNTLSPVVFANTAVAVNTINISGLGGQVLPVGEFIKFAAHSKVYTVKESVLLGENVNTITIFPSLVSPITINEVVAYGTKVTMAAKYGDDNQIGVTYQDGILAQFDSISLIEAL